MERFQHILFASCGGKDDGVAIGRANQLAMANKADITLIRVLEDIPLPASLFMKKKRLEDFQNALQEHTQKELDALAEKVDSSVEVKTKVVFGKPFIEIIRTIESGSHDLLIKPKIPTDTSTRLDSTDLHLLRKCPCPVWILKPNQRKPFGKIMIAVDPDPGESVRLHLHEDLIKLGTSLAEREQGKVEVVHSWILEGESTLRGPRFNMSEDEIASLCQEVETTHKNWMDQLLAPYAGHQLKVTMVKGAPGPTLIDLIEKKKPDIVVMGTVARTGLPGLIIGNTAEHILGQISCSIFAVKPKGFKSPVL